MPNQTGISLFVRMMTLYWRWDPDGPLCPRGGLLSPEEAFLFSDIGQKMKLSIEVIPYLLKSSLDYLVH